VVNTDGSGLTRLTHGLNGKRPSWSPDGARVAFESRQDSNHYLYVVNTDGSNLTELVNNDFGFYGLSWSPDGTRILFATSHNDNDEIFVINADGSELTNLSNHPASDMYPAWSPDGTRILFETYHDDNDEIYVMNIDGSGRTNLTNHPAEDSSPAWSPDGTHIAFASDREKTEGSNIFNDTEIYVMNADGSGLIRLTNRVGFDAYPSWSPDGTRIAFTSKRSDDWTIHIVNADGTGLYYLIGGLENDERALWSPVGQSASISQSTIPAPALPTVQIIQDGAPFCLRWLDFKNPDRNLEKGSWISVHGSYRDLNNDWWLAVELEDGTKGWVQNFGVALEGLDVETLPQLVPDSW
jgi:TolB protein